MSKIDRRTPPPIHDFGRLTLPARHVTELHNGVHLGIVDTGDSPANRLSVMWNYGISRSNGTECPSMVAPMLMQGTRTMTGLEIVDAVDFLGAFLSNRTYSEYTRFEALSLNKFTPRLLDIMTEVITAPIYPEERFEALRREAVAKFEVNRSHSRFVAQEAISQLIAGKNHPYLRPTSIENITGYTLDDVRKAHEAGANHTEIYINVAGRIDDDLRRAVENFARSIRPRRIETTPSVIVPHIPEPAGRTDIHIDGTHQASIAVAIPTINRNDKDYIPLRIAVTALGGYFGSRLMTNIREEKGLTYGIAASLMGAVEGASINISAECRTDAANVVLDEINNEILRLATEPMDDAELARLKSYYMTTIAATLESFRSIGDYYENQLVVGTPADYFEAQQTALHGITAEQLSDLVSRYILPEAERIVVVS